MRFTRILLIAGLAGCSLPLLAQPKWTVTKTMHVGGEGAWDYVTVDSPNHRLFVTRATHTQAIDETTGKVLGDIQGQVRSHGTAIVPALNRGFITDGGGNGAIVVFDLKTYETLGKLDALPDADGIIYDPSTNLVLAVSGDGAKLITLKPDIDLKTGKIDTIDLGGKPEFLAADGEGMAYINLIDKDVVVAVDLKAAKVTARWPVSPGGKPVGMALDRKNHQLYIGCRDPQKLIVMSTKDGKVLADLPIGVGVDATKIDGDTAFASCSDGTLSVVGQKNGKYEVLQVVQTQQGSRTMGVDTATHSVYLPAAEFEPPAPGASPARPTMKPDSFSILVVATK